jgi:hypothetical protein
LESIQSISDPGGKGVTFLSDSADFRRALPRGTSRTFQRTLTGTHHACVEIIPAELSSLKPQRKAKTPVASSTTEEFSIFDRAVMRQRESPELNLMK